MVYDHETVHAWIMVFMVKVWTFKFVLGDEILNQFLIKLPNINLRSILKSKGNQAKGF